MESNDSFRLIDRDVAVFFLCALLGVAALFVPAHAKSQAYLVGGAGLSFMPHIKSDGYWYQEPLEHSFKERSLTWRIGVGYKLGRFFAAELDYRDLGKMSGSAMWAPDSMYDNAVHKVASGAPINALWSKGSSHGLALSGIAKYPLDLVSPFIRYGIYQSHYSWRVDYTDEPYAHGMLSWSNSGVTRTRFYGIGAEIHNWSVEFNWYHRLALFDHEPLPGFDNARTVTVAYSRSL